MRKLLSKIFNRYTIGFSALFSSTAALAADGGFVGTSWPLLLLGGVALGGIIWAISDSSDDDEIFS